MIAEDLAIRHADASAGRKSSAFRGMDAYHAVRDQCMARLVADVAGVHGVSENEVRRAVGQRSHVFDIGLVTTFGVLLAAVALVVTRRISAAFDASRSMQLIALAAGSLAFAAIGFLAGDLWSGLLQSLLVVRNGHMSFRVGRLFWRQYPAPALAGCLVLYWIVAFRSARARSRLQS